MADPSVPAPMRAAKLNHCRSQMIYYMGLVVDNSSSSPTPLKKIIRSREFVGLLTLLSGVGTQNMIKLLQSASQNCAAKKAEIAESNNAKKRADAVTPPTTAPATAIKGTTHDESGGSESLLPHLEECNIQRLSQADHMPVSLRNYDQIRRKRPRLSGKGAGRNAEVDDDMILDSGSVTASLRLSDQSSHGDDASRTRVKIEYEDSAPKSEEKYGAFRQIPGQLEDEQIHARRKPHSAKEHGGKAAIDGTGCPAEAPSASEKALQLEAWDMYNKEVGIIRRDAKIIAPIEDHCCTALVDASNCGSGNLKKEVGQVLSDIEQLDFLFAKDRLVKYLNNRQAKLGMQTATPATWTMSEPQQVLGALRTIKNICDDAHIHRAFGQMKLCLLVQEKVKSGHIPISSGKGMSRLPETNYLEEIAREEAGPLSEAEIEAKYRDYLSEYQAGKRWLQVADWFGGPGIVLVFITAGIGSFHVAAGWKVFQRRCLNYISQSLYSIKGLVDALGIDCLEKYCQYGHLPQNYINKVIEYEGIIPAEEIDEDGSELDDTEDASGAEVHDGKEEGNGIETSHSVQGPASGEDTSGDDEDASESGQDVLRPEENAGMED
ncbi:hypothetical protein JMJ35_003460 [Cladonia borealis]|uniref:Uncharacterized protein n=1 Tax=Cladonia borealis TaxID=184061 RepID=A0AA39R2L6_9LECA|nr:hypothetical protein JMJ35_003460 [Cladonia borealis]